MIADTEKRKFLIQHLGRDAVEELERLLPAFRTELERRGIAWKDVATFDEHEETCRLRDLVDALTGIVVNIVSDFEVTSDEKRRLLSQAAEDFSNRVDGLGIAAGTKERRSCCRSDGKSKRVFRRQGERAAPPAARKFVDDLLGRRGGQKATALVTAVKAIEEGRGDGHQRSIAPYVTDLLAGKIVRQA